MSRDNFELQLVTLQEDVLSLSSMVEEALLDSVSYLKRRDLKASRDLIAQDRQIDSKRYAIEADALGLIATQQPVAGDMRRLAATLFIANELERIGDYAKGISRANIRIGEEPLMKPLIDVPRMAEIGQHMVHSAIEAFASRSLKLAQAVIAEDDLVDGLYDQVYAELLTLVLQNPDQIKQANLLLMVAHNLERAADRATNICERVVYCVTGKLLDSGWDEEDVA